MADKRNPNISLMQDMIEEEVTKAGYIYRAGKQERNRINNILTAKAINGIAEKYEMDIFEFVRTIISFSHKLKFWEGTITNAEKFYRNYDTVFNQLIKMKKESIDNVVKQEKDKFKDAESDYTF